MALPTTADFKEYARIQTTAEDYLIGLLMKRAYGMCESYMGKSIARVNGVYYDDGKTGRWREEVTTLIPPMYPFDIATLVVQDRNDAVVDAATYYVDPESYMVRAKLGTIFPYGPYKFTADYGIATSPTYAVKEEPILAQCILDVALMFYQQRTPNASSERASDSSVTYVDASLPTRVKALLAQVRGPVLAP
jgi:hypothetical protein